MGQQEEEDGGGGGGEPQQPPSHMELLMRHARYAELGAGRGPINC